ncbi:MAG: methyltransferase domain-containing protein [Deltaproteobacteria bacterium]|nr:methyltransferase domain-containing protein [Deltaproteobacteria bacterium]
MECSECPSARLAALQAAWLAPLRTRLLRRALVARRARVLDLGSGHGATTLELARRAGGSVVALDRRPLRPDPSCPTVGADAVSLPFRDCSFDLVFSQFFLLWAPLGPALAEVARVLAPQGAFVALEPDFGGLVEHPASTAVQPLWMAALERAGADPLVGRALPSACAALGLEVEVHLASASPPPSPRRFDLLSELPLLPAEAAALARARASAHGAPPGMVAHLPVFGVLAHHPCVRFGR